MYTRVVLEILLYVRLLTVGWGELSLLMKQGSYLKNKNLPRLGC